MNLNRITWTSFFFIAIISFALWFKFSYPQLAITNLSIDRNDAIEITNEYLQKTRGVDVNKYQKAAIFGVDGGANRFLQKTIGSEGLKNFIDTHDYDMFFWKVRYFIENVKEEYQFRIDSGTGEVTAFKHIIDENEARREITREEARTKAIDFLAKKFGFDPKSHKLRGNLATIRDNRSDFHFSWQKKSVDIPWSDEENSGTGKLMISTTVSGDEILAFSKYNFTVPDQFNRDLNSRKDLGRNILAVIRVIVLLLLISGIYLIIVRQNHLAMHSTKKFYIGIMIFSLTLSILSALNQFQYTLYAYKTTLAFNAYLWRTATDTLISALFITIAILIPGLAGELLHFETSSKQGRGSFLHYLQTTFLSRHVGALILLGYFIGLIMLGIQSILVRFGETYLGVWTEYSWITNSSTAYLPFLAAFTFSFKTAFSEEIMYRLYAINLGKKIFHKIAPNTAAGNIWIVVIITSLIWGFAHSGYPIFPMWFRGLEVTCLGLFLAFIYLKFGLIPVLVAHYLFDIFWSCTGYLFGISKPFYFYSSLFILLLPLTWAAIAFWINRQEDIKPLRWHLNKRQLYNLEILKAFLSANKDQYRKQSKDQIIKEITSHGWDPAVVDVATDDFLNNMK